MSSSVTLQDVYNYAGLDLAAPVQALHDKLLEMGTSPHEWEDVSYHGSPIYECTFCGCRDNSDFSGGVSELPCIKSKEALEERRRRVEASERIEYARLKAERQRWEYLHEKYGGEG